MLRSLRYTTKSQLAASTTFAADKSKIVEIGLFKLLILLSLFIFPPILDEEALCIIVTLLVSFQFWISKNLGRKFLNANWYIDTSSENDEWVYEAGMRSPSEIYEGIFWYSFIVYGLILIPLLGVCFFQSKFSLSAAIVIGIVANYINFYAFSNVISMRNQGVLQLISNQVVGVGVAESIKLPMIYQSKLSAIKEEPNLESI